MFSIDRKYIINNLNKLNKLIFYKINIDYLSGILFNIDKDKITLIYSDGNISVKIVLNNEKKIEIEKTGSFLIKSKNLLNVIKKCDSTLIKFKKNKNILSIHSENYDVNLNLLDYKTYPTISFEYKNFKFIKIKNKELYDSINQTFFSINENEKRIILTGLNILKRKNIISFTSTDSYRLSKKNISLNKNEVSDIENNFSYIIPYKLITNLKKIIGEIKNDNEEIVIYYNDKEFYFIVQNLIIKSKNIVGDYPDIDSLIPKTSESSLIINKDIFYNAIERVNIINNTLSENVVAISLTDKTFKLSSHNMDTGEASELIKEYKKTGKDIDISLNPKFVLDALNSFKNNIITINFNDNTSSVIFREKDNKDLFQLILPIKIYKSN